MITTWDALVLKGKVKVNAATDSLEEEPYHTLVLSQEQNQTGVAIQATEDETELVVVRHTSGPMILQINPVLCQIAGEPLNQGVIQYGPFGERHVLNLIRPRNLTKHSNDYQG